MTPHLADAITTLGPDGPREGTSRPGQLGERVKAVRADPQQFFPVGALCIAYAPDTLQTGKLEQAFGAVLSKRKACSAGFPVPLHLAPGLLTTGMQEPAADGDGKPTILLRQNGG